MARDRLEWLGGLDGVERAEVITSATDPQDDLILLRLTKGLADDAVNALTGKVKKDFESRRGDYLNSIEVELDGYRGRFYPSPVTKRDTDLERALWLRRDGRATAVTYGASGQVVTAPASAVAAVALGFEAAAPVSKDRRTHRVESADRQAVVEWAESPYADFRLDRKATQYFADLQARYPGVVGWLSFPERQAGIHFAATDLTLDALLEAPPKAELFERLEVGWGIVHAPATVFAAALTQEHRRLATELAKVAGVTGLEFRDDGGKPDLASVRVKDRAGYVGAVATLRRIRDAYVPIELVRRPSEYPGRRPTAVFRGSPYDQDAEYRIHAAIADLAGVTEVQIGPRAANLSIAQDISDADLTSALKAMATLPATVTINLSASQGGDKVGVIPLGRIARRQYVPQPTKPPTIDPALITRLSRTWAAASR
ncbi:hypothetical protein [Kribbella amoyensis]|nr:hypothetical protein [Kribbella amoyensis]